MNKKLIAIAVAGAFAAPAVAFAQSSTVQIYGKITYEYARIDQGDGLLKTDYADSPGGTAIGFKGEEKLGGGLSAWFQCESSADVRGVDQYGFCTRNSAIGFKGGFGNVFFGRWDTPMKRALNMGTVGAQETGSFGMSNMMFGGSGGASAIVSGSQGEFGPRSNRNRWKRRETAMSSYESPKFGGFQLLAGATSGNDAADSGAAPGAVNPKPRVISVAGTYAAGPLAIGLGYEEHNDFNTVLNSGDDSAWGLSGAYTFGNVKVGATYLKAKYETAATTELKKDTWSVGVDWAIAGPHGLEAQYGQAGDSKGNAVASITDVAPSGANTGGKQYSLAYRHSFSKRTEARLIYVRINNDSAAGYSLGTGNRNLGQDQSAFGFHLSHRF